MRWAYELQDRYPPDPDAPTGVPQVLRTGEPEFFPELPQELLDEAIGDDEELRRIIDELGLKSTICVPLVARGRTLGALTLIAAETHPPYTEADLALAVELARRAAVAVDNARLYREAERGADAARALAYVADGVVAARHATAACATGTRPRRAITGVAEEEALGRPVADVVPAWDALTSHVPLVPPGGAARPVTVPIVLGGRERWVVGLGRRVRRRHRLRAPGRDRGARAREDAQRLRRHRLARAAHSARGRLRRRPHAAARRRRADRRRPRRSSSR